jgi:hypothetical protein
VVVSGQYAYLADGGRGLQVLDIGDARRPTAVGGYRGSSPQSVAMAGSHVIFLAPFRALDVANPNRPEVLGTVEDNECSNIALAGDVAYLTGNSTLRAVDVSDPAAPKVLAVIPLGGAGNGLVASRLNAFVGCNANGLNILDVHMPTEPRRGGIYYPDTPVRDVAVHGNSAYLTVSEDSGQETIDVAGLEVIDIADLQRPVRTSKITLPVVAHVSLMAGSYACVTGDGLRVIDLGDPAQPVCVGQHQLGTSTFGLQVVGNLAYVAAGEYGLAIYRLTPRLILQPPVQLGTELRLFWLGGPGIRLQRTTSLAKPDWQDVPNSEGSNSVRLPTLSAASFFRLIRP